MSGRGRGRGRGGGGKRGRGPGKPTRESQKSKHNTEEAKEEKARRKAAEAKAEAVKGSKLPLTLEYLRTWATNRSEWKFKKVRQNVSRRGGSPPPPRRPADAHCACSLWRGRGTKARGRERRG